MKINFNFNKKTHNMNTKFEVKMNEYIFIVKILYCFCYLVSKKNVGWRMERTAIVFIFYTFSVIFGEVEESFCLLS